MAIIIAGYAGVGKTTLAKKYKNVLDLESTPYRWIVPDYKNRNPEHVKGLNIPGKTLNPNFPNNYISAIKENFDKYDYILVWCHHENSFPHYDANGIDYEIFVPTRASLPQYRQRYIDRGNNMEYVERASTESLYNKRLAAYIASGRKITYLDGTMGLEDYLTNHPEYPPLIPKDE